jgi:predicted RNase H-like HicB family nuclease
MRYAIIIEKGENNYSAYAPDVPGCVATGNTLKEVQQQMKEALEFHFEGMRLDGDPVPPPTSLCRYVDVEVPEAARKLRPKNRSA